MSSQIDFKRIAEYDEEDISKAADEINETTYILKKNLRKKIKMYEKLMGTDMQNDAFENIEAQTNQAAGVYFKWRWPKNNSEIYAEFYHNDAKQNIKIVTDESKLEEKKVDKKITKQTKASDKKLN